MRWIPAAFVVVLCATGVVPGVLAAQSTTGPASRVELHPGDVVRLVVWRNEEMSGEFEIRTDSTIGHPILREVKVAGIPLEEAEQRLRVFLGRFESNPALVLLPQYRIFVGGEVNSPGIHNFSPTVTIAQAILLAGGPTDRARLERVRLVRGGQEQTLDLRTLDSRQARQLIQSDDQILVERRRSLFRDYIRPTVTFLGSVTAILTFASRL